MFDVHTITRTGPQILCERAHIAYRGNKGALLELLRKVKPDVIVDMIPFIQEEATLLITALTTLGTAIPVIALSSIDVYAAYANLHRTETVAIQQRPITEDMALRTQLGPEGKAYDKLSVEYTYTKQLKSVCILRLPAIYGWPDTTRVSQYLDHMLDGDTEIVI